MDQGNLILLLRDEARDKEQPYAFDDNELLRAINTAISDYSRHRPRVKKEVLSLIAGQTDYPLPSDYQTYVKGLEDYEVYTGTLYLDDAPVTPVMVPYFYLGSHDIVSVPETDTPIIVDYCVWKLYSDMVIDGTDVSQVKIGKLDIQFANIDQITDLAKKRYENYVRAVKKVVGYHG
jgi:hypothetical protein